MKFIKVSLIILICLEIVIGNTNWMRGKIQVTSLENENSISREITDSAIVRSSASDSSLGIKNTLFAAEEAKYIEMSAYTGLIQLSDIALFGFHNNQWIKASFDKSDSSWENLKWEGETYGYHASQNKQDEEVGFEALRDGVFLIQLYMTHFPFANCTLNTNQTENQFVILDFGWPKGASPLQLENGKIALAEGISKRSLINSDGKVSNVQLKFDYGRELKPQEVGEMGQRWGEKLGTEYFAECIAYGTESNKYFLVYAKSTLLAESDAGKMGVAVFDENGNQLNKFCSSKCEIVQFGPWSYLAGEGKLLMLNDKQLLYYHPSRINPTILIDLKEQQFDQLNMEQLEKLVKSLDGWKLDDAGNFTPSPSPCPLIVEYAPDGTHVYKRDAEKTLIDTLDKAYRLAFYAVDNDGTCYLAFDKE